MENFQNEIIGFIVVAIIVIMLAFYESKIKERNNSYLQIVSQGIPSLSLSNLDTPHSLR